MSTENTTTDLTIKVPDYDVTTQTFQQFGMRYPDGTVKWVSTSTPNANLVYFAHLADGNPTTRDRWATAMRQRAESARVGLDEYIEGHQLVKRTVIVAVTGTEEV